jgi:hypothetical protein
MKNLKMIKIKKNWLANRLTSGGFRRLNEITVSSASAGKGGIKFPRYDMQKPKYHSGGILFPLPWDGLIFKSHKPAASEPTRLLHLLLLLFLAGWTFGCEEELAIELPAGQAKIVVQGHIQQGASPFVMLTESVPVLAPVTPETFLNSFVRGAAVSVTVDGQTYPLQEVALNRLPPDQLQLLAELYSLPAGPLPEQGPEIPFFLYTNPDLKGETGKKYQLRVEHQGRTLTALTSIPALNPLDSLWFRPHPDPKNDSLLTLWYRYHDPDTLGNSIRYMTKRNQEPFYPGYFTSVFNDELVNGKTIRFPLDRGESRADTIKFETYSFFRRGDSVTVRWAAIDFPHYQFWLSLEADRNSNGNPFGSPITVRSNVKGGLGIWGGYGTTYHSVIAPK